LLPPNRRQGLRFFADIEDRLEPALTVDDMERGLMRSSAKPRSEARYALPPIDEVVLIIAGRDRAARHQEQHLAQRIHDLPGLPRMRDLRTVIERRAQARRRGLDRFLNRFIMNKAYQNRDDVLAIRALYVGGDTQCVQGFSHFGCLDRSQLPA
jgi:hypothetical protein